MRTQELIREIQQLPVEKRMIIVERTLKSIRKSGLKKNIESAVNSLMDDYKTNKDLTFFTTLDFDNFYETK